MRKLIVLVGALSAIASRPAAACLCPPPPPPLDVLMGSSMVFEGTVTALATDGAYLYADVRVLRRWKAPDVATMLVATPAFGGAACGLEFKVGETWLLYTQSDCGLQVASLCTYARPIANAAADLAALGPPLAPGSAQRDGGVSDGGTIVDAGACRDSGAPRLDFAPPPDLPSPTDDLGQARADLAPAGIDLGRAPPPDAAAAAPDGPGVTATPGCGCALGTRPPGSLAGIVIATLLFGLAARRRPRTGHARGGSRLSARAPRPATGSPCRPAASG